MINLGYDVIDLHTHLRGVDERHLHLDEAMRWGINALVYMPNTEPCLDQLTAIREYSKGIRQWSGVRTFPTSAITIGREGKTPVDIDEIYLDVVGFTDDGNCLKDLDILEYMLKRGVLVMVHSEPETKMVEEYLQVLGRVGGNLHIQHVSKAETVELIREAKKSRLWFSAETCPHYCYYNNTFESHPVNPPLGSAYDMSEIREGLADGTIDIIASDYAPKPRPKKTGFASFATFIPLCVGLVLDHTLTSDQLRQKINENPRKIIASGNSRLLVS